MGKRRAAYSHTKRSTSKTVKKRNKHRKRTSRKSRTYKKLNCSPYNTSNPSRRDSCFSTENLTALKDAWNQQHPENKITVNDPSKIWDELRTKYGTLCDKESCWVSHLIHSSQLKHELMDSFAPRAPRSWKKNPNEWLSSIDILAVMKQHEKKYRCFEFMGPSPIDFDAETKTGNCVWRELCQFQLDEQIKQGKTKIGIIFNTDTHDKDGEHWISMFINIKKGQIFYFDSVGKPIPKQIKHFADRIIEQGSQMRPPIHFILDQNYPVEHQYGNTECGMYALYFIIHMLEDKVTAHYLKTHIIKDKYVHKFRKIYFNDDL